MGNKTKEGPKPPNKSSKSVKSPISPSSKAPAAPAAGASSFSSETKQTEQTKHEDITKRWTYLHPGNVAIAAALGQTQGRVLQAAALLRVERNTLKSWIDASPDLQKARRDAREGLLEMAEDSLLALVQGEYSLLPQLDEYGRPVRHYTRLPSQSAIEFTYRLAGYDLDDEDAEPDAQSEDEEDEEGDGEDTQVKGETELPDNGRGPAV